ncbi:exodeoxyribonuclease III [Candidatus Saccharibacteria bacterium]|nr:exodeoxyribonuclease III [Candidatus Saccharibacteria bacterium]
MLKIFSWNVNGVRAVLRKGALQEFIDKYQPDILCLQEIKAKPEQVEYDFPGYKIVWNPAKRAGYSGTATLFSEKIFRFVSPKMYIPDNPDRFASLEAVLPAVQCMTFLANKSFFEENSIAVPEGRVQIADCNNFYLVNVYTPNSKPDLSRLKLRHESWDLEFLQLLKELEKTKPVVACGDFNAAHQEIDLARPKTNHHNAGFTDEEREGIGNIIGASFIDTFRKLHPDEQRYTWWSHWGKARENNVGWRIDYFFVSGALENKVRDAEIYENVMGSDHCPISITLEV